jgi:hypothetical protein
VPTVLKFGSLKLLKASGPAQACIGVTIYLDNGLNYVVGRHYKKYPITGLERALGFQEFEAPRFQDNRHVKFVSLSALAAFTPQEIFAVLISVRVWVDRKHYVNEKFQ